jgi:DNA-directed RNA polymerase specialized sigma24 family protein
MPFVLTELSDVAIPEGARSLNMGVGAYRTRLYRARNRVRSALRALERDGEMYSAGPERTRI